MQTTASVSNMVPVPSLSSLRRITGTVDSIDSTTEHNRQLSRDVDTHIDGWWKWGQRRPCGAWTALSLVPMVPGVVSS